MGKIRRHVLSLEPSIDYELIGICSHHSDYRLAWGLNKQLRLSLAKSDEPFVINNKKGGHLSEHSFHFWVDESVLMEYYLIKNKCSGKYLLPEKQQIDYFLIIRENTQYEIADVLDEVKLVSSVMAAYIYEPTAIPSCEQIVF